MAAETFRYEELTATQPADLDRERTLALMALSPLEVHGPHLPLGTDVLVALELQRRVIEGVPEDAPMRRLLGTISGIVGSLGGGRLARDLNNLGHALGWLGMERMPTYMGDPSLASPEAGERMLEAHVAEAMAMLEEVRADKPPFSEPVLWDLRFIEGSR